jgi:hypothetical protein
MTRAHTPAPRPHRGMPVRQRLVERDSYGILLVLIVLALLASTLSIGSFGSFLRSVTIGAVLLFALRTSGASRVEIAAAGVLVAVAALLSLPFEHDSTIDRGIASAASLVLAVAVIAAIVRRVGSHPVVSGATIAAALCIYLMLGIAFAAAYGLVGAVEQGGAFAGTHELGGDGSTLERTYFSFTTLTTVGFGDLAPASDVMRMLAVTEAFTGQLYLVTVVALLVANLGRERRPRPDDGSSEPDGR